MTESTTIEINKIALVLYFEDALEKHLGASAAHVLDPATGEQIEIIEPLLVDLVNSVEATDSSLFYSICNGGKLKPYMEEATTIYMETC